MKKFKKKNKPKNRVQRRRLNAFRLESGLIVVHPPWCVVYNDPDFNDGLCACWSFASKAEEGKGKIETECVGCDLYQGKMKSEVENEKIQ